MPFRVSQLERVGELIGADLVGRGKHAGHLLQLFVICHQRLEIDAEPGESARRGKRIEIALETAGADVEAAGQSGGLGRGGEGRNGRGCHHRSQGDGGR